VAGEIDGCRRYVVHEGDRAKSAHPAGHQG
jgi:hypothetical protein